MGIFRKSNHPDEWFELVEKRDVAFVMLFECWSRVGDVCPPNRLFSFVGHALAKGGF